MRPAPVHEHVYSDGKICLNILYSDWDPKMDVRCAWGGRVVQCTMCGLSTNVGAGWVGLGWEGLGWDGVRLGCGWVGCDISLFALQVKSLCLSLLSMLSSAQKKGRPPDNDSTVVLSQVHTPLRTGRGGGWG